MKFGGHETFFLRPNWLTKGLVLVEDYERRNGESAGAGSKGRAGKGVESVVWNGEAASDEMGVGRNMSKSIGWWLNRLGLVERNASGEPLRVSPLGAAFLNGDRYFAENASWWLLHVILTLSGREDVFSWFFGKFREPRFAKSGLDGKLVSWVEDNGRKLPSLKTLQRDTAVMLQSYARPVPMPARDPEDNLDCPLRRLGLFVHRTETGSYERRAVTGKIPPAAVAMALSLVLDDGGETAGASGRSGESGRSSKIDKTSKSKGDVPLGTSGALPRLARVFGLDLEGASAAIVEAGKRLGSKSLAIRHLPQGNVATVSRLEPHVWVATHFEEVMETAGAARAAHAAPGGEGGGEGARRTYSATPGRNRSGRRPANPSNRSKPTNATESARPAKPAKSAKPTKSVNSAKAAKPTKSTKSAAAAKPEKPTKAAKLAKDGKARKAGKVARTESQPGSKRGKIAATASSHARARKGEKAA